MSTKESEFQKLINLSIPSFHRIHVKENSEEYVLDDSIVIKTTEYIIQILIKDNRIKVRNVHSISDLTVWDIFKRKHIEIHLSLLRDIVNPRPVAYIQTHTHGNIYTFGLKFLDSNKSFITALCLGFDEIQLLDEPEFESMTLRYSSGEIPVNIKIIS